MRLRIESCAALIKLRKGRDYVAALEPRPQRHFATKSADAANDAAIFAPLLELNAA